MSKNIQVLMKQHPKGWVTENDFEIVEHDVPKPGPGEVLVRTIWLSLDPYMRGAMDPVRSYRAHLNPGDRMLGGTVGEVIESHNPKFPKGAFVLGMFGWQAYGVSDGTGLRVVDAQMAPLSAWLGVLGMPGVTAHYGLLAVGEPKPGETVVVSAATGAVGATVGQIAKIKGCRVVGIAGGAEKCDYAIKQLRLDACIDHKATDMAARFKDATPNFVDVDFENVGGPVMDMVFARLNAYARVALCGLVGQYNAPAAFSGMRHVLVNRARVQGFIISEHPAYFPGAIKELAGWLREGKLTFKEDVAEGLANAPKAFIGMLAGRNFGKQLVRVGPDRG